MPTVVPVRMHFSTIDLWFDPCDTDARTGDHVIVSTERGTEIGLVTADPFHVPEAELRGELKPVLRIATDEDLDLADELAARGEEAMPAFREFIKQHELDMKPVGVEFLFGGEKAVFYFAAEDRVDFRDLVRDLTAEFHQRVDMRQIGVRDEARLIGGYAPCGQELCCVRFSGEFEPVSIRMAKEQDLPLNSAKISGVCGRLMCCLRYEFEAYRDFKQRAPKKNAVIDTPLGKAKIVEYNTPRELITLRLENGKVFSVPLKDMTCSEGCRKACDGQCAPRPDTVGRDALEKLGTAEIMLQLAELDRINDPNGYTLDDSLIAADRKQPRKQKTQVQGLVRTIQSDSLEVPASMRVPRRRPSADVLAENAQQPEAPLAAQPKEKAASQRQRGGGMKPRRLSKSQRSAASCAPADQASVEDLASNPAQGRHSRRHHTVVPSSDAPLQDTPATVPAASESQPSQGKARRGHRDGRTVAPDASQQTSQQGAPQEQGTSPKRKRTHVREASKPSQGTPDAAPKAKSSRGERKERQKADQQSDSQRRTNPNAGSQEGARGRGTQQRRRHKEPGVAPEQGTETTRSVEATAAERPTSRRQRNHRKPSDTVSVAGSTSVAGSSPAQADTAGQAQREAAAPSGSSRRRRRRPGDRGGQTSDSADATSRD